jgi:hypothetical protein
VLAATVVAVAIGLFLQAQAMPKAYLAPAAATVLLFLVPVPVLRRWLEPAAYLACAATLGAAILGWATPLSAKATARAVTQKYPQDHRNVSCRRESQWGRQAFGRTFTCYWGQPRRGYGIGIEVDDTHIVEVYP